MDLLLRGHCSKRLTSPGTGKEEMRVVSAMMGMWIAFCLPVSAAQSLLEPRWLPSNMLKASSSCDLSLLQTGNLLREPRKVRVAGDNTEVGRVEISDGAYVDFCVLRYSYTSPFLPNPRPETWDEAGPDLQHLIQTLTSKSASSFQGKFDGGDAVFYPQGKTAAFVAIKQGPSARQIQVAVGYASLPFALNGYGVPLDCSIPGIITVSYRELTTSTLGFAPPGSDIESLCNRGATSCSRVMHSMLRRGERLEKALAQQDTEKGLRHNWRRAFRETSVRPVNGTPGLDVFEESWFGAKFRYVVDLRTNTVDAYVDGKRLNVAGTCKTPD